MNSSRIKLLPRELLVQTGPVDHADWNYRGVLGWVQQRRFRLIVQLMGGDRFPRLLELGYGSGVFMPELGRHADQLSGVDIHDRAQEVTAALGRADLTATLKQGVAEAIPFNTDAFDAVVAVSVLEFVDDMEATCRELARVLSPGGSLFVVTPGKSPLVDLGLRVLTGKSAKDDFGDRRERVLPALKSAFRVTRRIEFPNPTLPGVRLYTALRLVRE